VQALRQIICTLRRFVLHCSDYVLNFWSVSDISERPLDSFVGTAADSRSQQESDRSPEENGKFAHPLALPNSDGFNQNPARVTVKCIRDTCVLFVGCEIVRTPNERCGVCPPRYSGSEQPMADLTSWSAQFGGVMRTFTVPCPQCGSLEPHELSRRVARDHEAIWAHCHQCATEWQCRLRVVRTERRGVVSAASGPSS
jgi:hypothetical protein